MFALDDSTVPSVSVHDAVLAAIPLLLLVVAAVGVAVSLSIETAVALGSLPASGTVGYALFYNPPEVDRASGRE